MIPSIKIHENYPVKNLKAKFKSLESEGLFACPKSSRQHFWIDLWNEMSEISSLRIHKSQKFVRYSGEHTLKVYDAHKPSIDIHQPMLQVIHQSWDMIENEESLFHLDVKGVYQELAKDIDQLYFEHLNWKIGFRDGMLLLIENGISRVICLLDEIYLPKEEMIQDLVSVVYLAKIAGIQINKMSQAIEAICGIDHVNTQLDAFTGSQFVDYSKVSSFEECNRILKYFDHNPIVILGGAYCMLDSKVEEQLIASEAVLIHIIDGPKAQDSLLKRFVDVYHVENIHEAVSTSYEITEKQSDVLFFGGIDLSIQEARKLGDAFIKEVLA